MALERDDGSDQATDPGEQGGSIRAQMTPERQEHYDAVLAGLEAGADQDPDAAPGKVTPKKGAGRASRSARPASAAPPGGYGDDRDAPDADDDDMELLPEEDGIVDGTEDPPRPSRKRPKPAPSRQPPSLEADEEPDDDEDEEEDDESADLDDDEDDDDDAPAAEDDDEADEDAVAAKAKVARDMRKLAAKEARDKAADKQRRAAYESERAEFIAEWQPRVAKVREFEALIARAERDPVGTIMEFATKIGKLEGAAWQHVSKQMFLRSPAARENPASAAEAAAAQRELESSGAVRALEEKIGRLTQTIEERDRAAENARAAKNYLKRAVGMADAETPLLRRMAKGDPAGLKKELHLLAAELAEEAGRAVHPRKLIRTWERRELARLERLGVKTKKAAADPAAAQTKKGAGKPKPAQPGANGAGAPNDRKALHADVLRGLHALPTGRAARA